MKTTLLRFLCLCAAAAATATATTVPASIAFVDVTVIPMDTERILPRQTVLVQGDRVIAVADVGAVQVPSAAQKIDGAGKFLIPGLAEMHGHNPPLGSAPEYFENIFFLFVANGVTTVRSMQGFPGQLAWRDKVNGGELVGPTLYLAGPSFSGQSVPSPQSAIERVRAQKAEGWDLLKIHPGIRPEVYDAIARTAHEVGIEFSGHIPADVGLVHAIRRGQRTVDHLDGYIEHLQADSAPVDAAKLAAIVEFTRETGTWVVPTMVLWETILGAADPDELARFPELRYMPRSLVQNWKAAYTRRITTPGFDAARARQIAANRRTLLQALADGDARIIFGTDAPQQFSVPGFSIHREFKAMSDAGLSNFAILQSATRNVGEYLAARDQFGTVAPGQRADLVLLHGSPLDDLEHVAKPAGVMVRGRWLGEADIQARLAKIAAANQNP
jgi:imidazolonepropionase-like amidohydrolase